MLRKLFCYFTLGCLISGFCLMPIHAEDGKYDGIVVPDYEHTTQIVHENGSIEGTIPLEIISEESERNITLPDGSQYRYLYLPGDHHWWYEFVIVGGFQSYSGYVRLTKYEPSFSQVSVPCSGQSDTVELPYNTRRCGYTLNQTGTVYGRNGKKYLIPSLSIGV